MPTRIYKNRPEQDPRTPLRQHMSLEALRHVLGSGQLRLTRTDQFPDPFEGSVPKKQIDDQLPLFSSRNTFHNGSDEPWLGSGGQWLAPSLDPWAEMTMRRRAKTRSAHASCWSLGPESEAMWRLYCNDAGIHGQGVAIEYTLGSLEESIAHLDLYTSPIQYRYYHEGPAFNDELDSYFHKRLGFAHEAELRLLQYDDNHYLQHALSIAERSPEPAPLPMHVFLPWAGRRTLSRILVSPYANPEYEALVGTTVRNIDPGIVQHVQLSVLSDRLHPPQF